VKTGFTFENDGRLDIDARAPFYFLGFAPPARLGEASFYLTTFRDAAGDQLRGSGSYRLHVPPNVPARQFWAVTVYDLETAGFFRESPRVSLDSFDQKMKHRDDGSVEIRFGPRPPAGHESNWIHTAPNTNWFAMFRFYGPEQPLFDKTWTLRDIIPADR
jgi:hypothetical protein